MYDTRFTKTYKDSVLKFQQRPEVLSALALALSELMSLPFGNPKLQTHAVKNCPSGTFTSYVGTDGHRLIWRLIDRVIVLLLIDEHDAAYRRAQRLRLEIDDRQNVLKVMDVDPSTAEPQPYEVRRQREGTLFMAWNDQDLKEMGLAGQEIPVLRQLDTEDDLLDLEARMRPDAFTTAYNLLAHGHPKGETAAASARTIQEAADRLSATTEPAISAEDVDLADALRRPGSERVLVPVSAADIERILSAPIEDWMVYLDPSQQDLVDRRFNGPARIRGAAGTGKTVVALHRARAAAREHPDARILFTTFIRTIPPVLDRLFTRFAPDDAESVEFKSVHAWALGLLGRSRRPMNVDLKRVDRAWKLACDMVVTAGSALAKAGLTRNYLRDEIDWIVKGRALDNLDDYLKLQRSGRGTPLPRSLRSEVWRLYEKYETGLAQSGVNDFNDVLIAATELVRDEGTPYTAVIVDEAQDLTENAIRLLHAAVGDRENGFLLVGDGQQSIYPGGFSLASLGVEVRGRAARLTHNYRNTRQIIEIALQVVDGQQFDDGDDALMAGSRPIDASRDGVPPRRTGFPTVDDHDLGLAAEIEAAIDSGCGSGDVAILVPTNRLVTEYAESIQRIGLSTQRLDQYDGSPNARVKVGTYLRAKGLEFKRVYLPRLDPEGMHDAPRHGEDEATYEERLALQRRRLFVAMTRARDALWLGWVGEPSKLLQQSKT